MRTVCRTLATTCVAWFAFGAGDAPASTVTVTLDAQFHAFNEVRYLAAPGETNNLTAHYAADALSVIVTDPGAVITAMGSCTSLSTHSAVCTAPTPPFPITGQFVQSVRALLGDMDDRAVSTRSGPNVIGGIDAFGGPGDDVLTGSPTEDTLDGGGGTDLLSGGDGSDLLSDGDVDGAAEGRGPDADALDGGAGSDTLSYAQRTAGVTVDLASGAPTGEPGEGDVARDFESLTGGRGNDRLAGDRRRNDIDGGAGSNRLIGRGGDDDLRHASGPEVLCGRGFDLVTGPRARTRIPPQCELLSIPLPRDAAVDTGATIRPVPHRKSGAFGFDVSCPETDGEPEDCRAMLRIRTSASRRLLASGHVSGPAARPFLKLHLTPRGRRLHGDGHRQLVTTVLRGPLMRRTAWTIAF